jgi:hypothetical protein
MGWNWFRILERGAFSCFAGGCTGSLASAGRARSPKSYPGAVRVSHDLRGEVLRIASWYASICASIRVFSTSALT